MSEKTQFATSAIYNLLGLLDPAEVRKVLQDLNGRFGIHASDPELPKTFGVQELAKRWRLHANTVRLMLANDPKLGAYQEGRKWLVRQDALDTYEKARSMRA